MLSSIGHALVPAVQIIKVDHIRLQAAAGCLLQVLLEDLGPAVDFA